MHKHVMYSKTTHSTYYLSLYIFSLVSMFTLFRYEIRSQRKRFAAITWVISVALLWYIMIDAFIWYADSRIANEAKPIAGADIVVERNKQWNNNTYTTIQSIIWDKWIISERIQLNTNITTSKSSFLVQLLWIDTQYPLYGKISIKNTSGSNFIFGRNIAVDEKTYSELDNGIIQIGNWSWKVDGIIEENLWLSLNLFTQWRQVLAPIWLMEETWLLRTGSRAEFQYLIKTINSDDNDTLINLLESSSLTQEDRDIDNFQDRVSQIWTLLNELGIYLILIIISGFLLVSATTMLSIEEYLYRRLKTMSIMQILWLDKTHIIILYLSIFISIATIAILIAIWASTLLASYISSLDQLKEFFITNNTYTKGSIITFLLVWVAWVIPLLKIMLYSPLQWLSENIINNSSKKEKIINTSIVLISGAVILHILWENWQQSLKLSAILLWWLIIIYAIVFWLLKAGEILNNHSTKSFILFDAIRATTKPWNTSYLIAWSLIVALSITLLISQFSGSFIARLDNTNTSQSNVFMINIPKEDILKIREKNLIKELQNTNSTGKYTGNIYNIVLGRIDAVNDIWLLDHLQNNKSITQSWQWIWRFTREFNITTIDLPSNDTIAWSSIVKENEVSIDQEFAKELWVTLWDSITFAISWRQFTVKIAWIRKSNRTNFWPFFYFQLNNDQFKDAPVTYFISMNIPEEDKINLKKDIIAITNPWINFIEIDNIVASVKIISTRIIQVVQILLGIIIFFTCFTTLVCIQSMRHAKAYKNKIYYILWATKKQTYLSIIYEYWYLLWIAIITSILLGRWTAFYFIQTSNFLTWSRIATLQWILVITGILIINWLFIRSSMQTSK